MNGFFFLGFVIVVASFAWAAALNARSQDEESIKLWLTDGGICVVGLVLMLWSI